VDEEDLSAQCVMILVGGHVTPSISFAMARMRSSNPDQWKKLREQPELIYSAVEEVLQYDTSVPFIHALRGDLVIRGQHIAKDIRVPGLASANHDPSSFPTLSALISPRAE